MRTKTYRTVEAMNKSKMIIYVDESGHDGDVVGKKGLSTLDSTPYFSLAGIGLAQPNDWNKEIALLRTRHKIPKGELKSKSLVSKPEFSAEVIHRLLDLQTPIFVEVVDKRYYIYTDVITFLFFSPSLNYSETRETHYLKLKLADFLYLHAPNEFYEAYFESRHNPGATTFLNLLAVINKFTSPFPYHGESQELAVVANRMLMKVECEYESSLARGEDAWLNFYTPIDLNKHGKPVWLLPNVSSFLNVYARANRFFGKDFANIQFLHDDQLEAESIIRANKELIENISDEMHLPFTQGADYRFNSSAALKFVHSGSKIGIQLADIVAGASMRFYRDREKGTRISETLESAMLRLIRSGDGINGYGLNRVVPFYKADLML